jgi:hypothetical protein
VCPVRSLVDVILCKYGRYWTRTSDPLLVEQGKEKVEFYGLVISVLVYLGLRPKWGV